MKDPRLYENSYYSNEDPYGIRKKRQKTFKRLQVVFKLITPSPEDWILDLGSGEGIFGDALNGKYGCTIVDSDISYSALKRIVVTPKRKKVNLNCTELPFHSEMFDYILFLEVIEHLSPIDGVKCLKEIHRVLKRQGKVVISHPNHGNLRNRIAAFVNQLGIVQIEIKNTHPHHIHEPTYDEIRKLLLTTGFTIQKVEGMGFGVPILNRIVRVNGLCNTTLSRLFPQYAGRLVILAKRM